MSRTQAPVADREPVSRELHGETVVDPYAWMRERESERDPYGTQHCHEVLKKLQNEFREF